MLSLGDSFRLAEGEPEESEQVVSHHDSCLTNHQGFVVAPEGSSGKKESGYFPRAEGGDLSSSASLLNSSNLSPGKSLSKVQRNADS